MPKRKMRNDGEKNISGTKIKQLRMMRGLTQMQFSARMEVEGIVWDQKTVSSVELQHRALFDYEIKAVAKVLETTVDNLLEMN